MAVFPAIFGLLMATLVSGQSVDISPREAVRAAGDEVTVLCKVAYPIDSCRMTVGSVTYRLAPSTQEGDVVYSGQGLQNGECGAHIRSVKEEWNGNISCILPPQSGNIEVTGTMKLIVARAPEAPRLYVFPEQPMFREGDTIQAQCVVPNGRPAAKITWFLGGKVLLIGPHQPIVTSEPGSDLQTVSQNLTRTLAADDNHKDLECFVEHEAQAQARPISRQLIVQFAPKRLEPSPTVTIFGLKLGSEGLLNVTVRANPEPVAEWTVDGHRVSSSYAENIVALPPIRMAGDEYNVTLRINSITKEDVDRTYSLRVYNELGGEDIVVRMSTMDEPAGVELGTGAIVGIVVAVLVLLLAVFLVVFAKATDRWCFGGAGRRDHTKNSGESSDTESAVGGRVERSRLAELGARVRAVLPRAKDKVQATEAAATDAEDKPLEDKKNVVYAELALGDGARDKPAPHSTEYAQIVYTTPPPEAKADAPADEVKDP